MTKLANATDDELRAAVDSFENWAERGAVAVIVGVVLEVILATLHPAYDSFLETWGTVIADSLVALGVAGEVLFSRMGSARQRELQRRADVAISAARREAGEANQRAAEAALELERLRAEVGPRMLTKDQRDEFLALKGRVPALDVVWYPDMESMYFATQIINALMCAGITVRTFNPRVGIFWSGVMIVFPGSLPDANADPLSLALHNAGLWTGSMDRPKSGTFLADLPRDDNPILMVGAKPLRPGSGGWGPGAPPAEAGSPSTQGLEVGI